MSPRAACRLEQLGVTTVYDYAAGKMDWLAHALPYEGTADLVSRRIREGQPDDVVTTPGGIVVAVRRDDGTTRYGPATIRPSEDREEVDGRMAKRKVHRVLVTDPDGRFLGTYHRHEQGSGGTPESSE